MRSSNSINIGTLPVPASSTTIHADQQNTPQHITQTHTTPRPEPQTPETKTPRPEPKPSIFNGNFLGQVFHNSHIIDLVFFLAIYVVVYIVMGFFITRSGATNPEIMMSRIFDYMVFGALFLYAVVAYYSSSDETKYNIVTILYNWSVDYMDNPVNTFAVAMFIIAFYLMVYLIRLPMSNDLKPFSVHLLENKAWILLVMLLFIDFFKYFLGINIMDIFRGKNPFFNYVYDVTTTTKPIDGNILKTTVTVNSTLGANVTVANVQVAGNTVASKPDEVFNISNNLYTYDDAQAICKSYGARLANYEDIEDSYNHGAEWCNYGWSEGQMAFFPTQKSTWQSLQSSESTKNACGRPGINGGYMANPYIKFGVNCYGKKPASIDDSWKTQLIQPATKQDSVIDQKVKFWKDNADKLLKINSFNRNAWSEY